GGQQADAVVAERPGELLHQRGTLDRGCDAPLLQAAVDLDEELARPAGGLLERLPGEVEQGALGRWHAPSRVRPTRTGVTPRPPPAEWVDVRAVVGVRTDRLGPPVNHPVGGSTDRPPWPGEPTGAPLGVN